MANRNYKELSDLLGKPSKGETQFTLGGPFADKIFDKTKWEVTAYAVCGPYKHLLINPNGREIARLSGPFKNWFVIDGKHTGYFLGGFSGRQIFYDKSRDEFLQ